MLLICQEILLRRFTPWELKELLKSISLSKPLIRQGLVLVERTVHHKNSKAFTQKFYVRPDQVNSSDRVILGHHNLPDGHPFKPDEIVPYNSTKPVDDKIKQKTAAFFDLFPTPTAFCQYIQHFGIHWGESNKPGIVLMRAKMALNNAQVNGLNLEDIMPQVRPTSNPPQPPVQQSTVAQNMVTSQDDTPKQKSITELADDFINSFVGPREFCRAMESMKIPYHHSYDHAKNLEGARQSLIANMENGVDLPALWEMNTKQLYDSIPSPPPIDIPDVQNSFSVGRSLDTIKEATNFFLGNGKSPSPDSPYGKWLSSAPSIFVRDMDDGIDKLLITLERKIINIYTRHSRDFNAWLRETFAPKTWGIGSFNNIPQLIHFFRRTKFMDDAIKRFEVPEPIVVHRHMPCSPKLLQSIINAPNNEFSDESYMSTSCLSKMEPKLAKKFQQTLRWDETPVHLEITVPQGKGWGMYVAPDSSYPDQCEFLLARGSKLEISLAQKQPDGSYYVKCKLVGNTQKDVTKLKYRQFIKKSRPSGSIDVELLKSNLLNKRDKSHEDPWERFITPLDCGPKQNPPEHRVNWQ